MYTICSNGYNTITIKRNERLLIMKKKIFFVTVLCLLVVCLGVFIKNNESNAEKATNNYDFRNVNWKMSLVDVLESENIQQIYIDKDSIWYKPTIYNMKTLLSYDFTEDNELYKATYVFLDGYDNKTAIQKYFTVKEFICEEYGNKTHNPSDYVWYDNYYKDDSSKHYLAVLRKDLLLINHWVKNNTKVTLTLYANEDTIRIGMIFEDLTYILNNI